MKVLLLNGSPKKQKSCTFLIAESFLSGIKKAFPEAQTEVIHISDLNVTPCLGCLSCWGRTEGECIIKNDDIPLVKKKILDSDIVAEAFPLYFFGMPGSVKVF
ncbi:MAG TPA: flavodoxin family protein, partial [Clostridiales bacterium]|nr:flavodoxin family protein [Clostridiales bacterium]